MNDHKYDRNLSVEVSIIHVEAIPSDYAGGSDLKLANLLDKRHAIDLM